jgi:hypothetical protein
MPAVTVATTKYNVSGSMRDQYYTVSGISNDFLVVGLTTVREVNVTPGSTITGVATVPGPLPGTTQINFTSSAAITNARIQVLGN